MRIPAICPQCEAIFPSGFDLDESLASFEGCTSGPCPKGHMGIVPDGTYSVFNGILRISRGEHGDLKDLQRMFAIARAASSGEKPTERAIEEIASLLPEEAAKVIRRLGSRNPLYVITFIICILRVLGTAVSGLVGGIKAIFPDAPVPQTVINDYSITFINPPTGAGSCDNAVSEPSKREQRRLRRMRRKQHIGPHREGR
jgi:hypothetical protein